jgi:hypothetical protein
MSSKCSIIGLIRSCAIKLSCGPRPNSGRYLRNGGENSSHNDKQMMRPEPESTRRSAFNKLYYFIICVSARLFRF